MLTAPQFYIEQGIPKARWMFPGRYYKARLLTLPRTSDEALMYIHVQNTQQVTAYQDEARQHELGTYPLQDFEKIRELPRTNTPISGQRNKFLAKVVQALHHFAVGDEYVISDPRADSYYSVYLKSRPDHAPVGSYITNFFEIVAPFEMEPQMVDSVHDLTKNERKVTQSVHDIPKTALKITKLVNEEPEKKNVSQSEKFEQLTLF
ncbi:hypothetical protein [Metasolibacillus sp.]|uniref:hypothetical protein n=1 Tax=Metasolibacillus sp. TaxID=2703680 RepID=UPI0025F0BF86|nr:hypothetical protein [Metasolibacillus sp.]MCT6925289.1 hypothetical protein [Metasolibacillus sp.]MCT6941481.1 hypothetical protein [Metasolibacillus sp.]